MLFQNGIYTTNLIDDLEDLDTTEVNLFIQDATDYCINTRSLLQDVLDRDEDISLQRYQNVTQQVTIFGNELDIRSIDWRECKSSVSELCHKLIRDNPNMFRT